MSIRDNRSAREENLSGGLRVAELVKVVRFNAESMTVDAQPLVKVSIDGTMANQPRLTGVPVAGLCMGDFAVRPWYKKGDIGLVIICDKDIDAALEGKITEPATSRNHDMTDAVFVGGIAKGGKAPSGLPDNALVLSAGSTYIAVKPDGIEVSGKLMLNGVNISEHTHSIPTGGDTGGPQ